MPDRDEVAVKVSISLPKVLADAIRGRIEAGGFTGTSDYVQHAIRLELEQASRSFFDTISKNSLFRTAFEELKHGHLEDFDPGTLR